MGAGFPRQSCHQTDSPSRCSLAQGYSIHFVMNITDIDDKIIVRARQNHLVEQFRSQHPHVTPALLSEVKSSWSAYFDKTLRRFAPPPPPEEQREMGEGGKIPEEAAWEEVSRLYKDNEKWRTETSLQEPKLGMWYSALDKARQAIIAATMSVTASSLDSSAAPTSSQDLIDASVDLLSSSLDSAQGHAVTDPSIFRALAAHWEAAYFDDMRRLGVLKPDQLTRVSEYVPEIVTFTEKIMSNGFAYKDERGNVWFDTRAFDGAEAKGEVSSEQRHSYAKLAPWSKGNRELLEEGEGSLSTSTTTTSGKRSASDFALWKSSKPGEPSWPSPWGSGRPGWHIECSVMASEVLGNRIDVHSGGVDLMFPHHDNELAQSEACHGCGPWINYFLHTGHLHIEGLKMSKSLKNFISIDEALQRFTARQLRMAFLMQSWSSRMDFRESSMNEVRNAEERFNNFFATVKAYARQAAKMGPAYSDGQHHYGQAEKTLVAQLGEAKLAFHEALCDSFDTPTAVSVLLEVVSKANTYEKEARRAGASAPVNAGVLDQVGRWVGDMLRMFGLGYGPVYEGQVGWGEDAAAGAEVAVNGDEGGAAGGGMDREALLMPYLEVLSNFRSSVRRLARSSAPHSELLALADRLRDDDLVDLGVALEDAAEGSGSGSSSGEQKAMVKLVPAAQLRAAREEKQRLIREKAARKEEAAQKAAQLRKEKLERGRAPPALMFKPVAEGGLKEHEGRWKEWDQETGLPTRDAATDAEVGKGARKKLEKERQTQVKLHEEFLAAKAKGEVE